MISYEKVNEQLKSARNQVEGLKQVLSDRKLYLEEMIKAGGAKLDPATGIITSKKDVTAEVSNAASIYQAILRVERAIDVDPAVVLLARDFARIGLDSNNKDLAMASKNAKYVYKKYQYELEQCKTCTLDLDFFLAEEKYIKNEEDKKTNHVVKQENLDGTYKVVIGVLGATAILTLVNVCLGLHLKSSRRPVPTPMPSTPIESSKPEVSKRPEASKQPELVIGSFINVNDDAEVESVIDEAMASLGDFASEANITREDMKNIIMALNAPYVANPDQITDDLRTDVNEKLFSLYKVYLGSNDTRLFGISDGKKNGPHNFELSKLFVASTPNLGLMQEFDQNLNFILDADEVTPEVTTKASTLYARAAYQTGVALSDTPIVDENDEECYGLMYAYSLACDAVYPIFEPCDAGFTTREGYVYSSKSGEDIVYESVADQLNRSGMKLQSYIKGNCKTLQ